mmetsp:Transcript_6751/g.14318  ORF Transcript_6751/g.14318 Transcript_6751/m.14318 type:complete len:912 (-) Transcript_6751:177-2912(-)
MGGMKLTSRFKKLAKSAKPSKNRKDGDGKNAKASRRPSLTDNSTIASKQSLNAYDGNCARSPDPPKLPTLGLATPETAATALSSVPDGVERTVLLRPASPAAGDGCGTWGDLAAGRDGGDDDGSRATGSSGSSGSSTGSYGVRPARAPDPPDIVGARSHDAERALRDRMQREIRRHRSEYEVEAEVDAGPVPGDSSPGSRSPSKTSKASAASGLSRASRRNIFAKLNRSRGEKSGGGKSGRKISSKSYGSRAAEDGADPQEGDVSFPVNFPGVVSAETGEPPRTADDSTAEEEEDDETGSYEECSFEGSVDPPSADEEDVVATSGCNVLDFSTQTRPTANDGGKFASPRTPKCEHEEDAVRSPVSPFLSWLGLATPGENDDTATTGSPGDTATCDDGTYDGTYDGTHDGTCDDTLSASLGTEVSYDPRLSGHVYSPGIEIHSDPVLGGRGPASSHTYSPGIQRRSDPPAGASGPKLARKHSFRLTKRSTTPAGGGEDRSQGGRSHASAGRTASITESSGGGTEVTAGGRVIEQKSDWRKLQNEVDEDRDDDPMQMDVYSKGSGGADQLILRKYGGGVPNVRESHHVLVEIEASTVSEQDCISRLEVGDSTNLVPGLFAVGTIKSTGSTVSKFSRRDRVAVVLPNGGGNAKYVSVPMSNLIPLEDNATHPDTVCLLGSYMTAYQCLKLAKRDGLPLTNANLLIVGGSTPVGQAMVELARAEGAKVHTTAHKMHEEHLRKLGAKWHPNKPKRWLPNLEGRMDAVIDMLCVDGYESSYQALTENGRLICTGGPSSMLDPDSAMHVGRENSMTDEVSNWWSGVKARYLWNRAVHYDIFESYEADRRMFAQELSYLVCKLQRGEISPKVAGRISLNQVPKAQKLVERGLPNGTIICLPWKRLDPKQNVRVESSLYE